MQPIISSFINQGVGRILTNRSHSSRHWWGGSGTLNLFLLHFTRCWGGKSTNTSTSRWVGIWWCHYKHMVNKCGWSLFCADVFRYLLIVYFKVEKKNQLTSGAFHFKAMFIDEVRKAWAWNWMFCPTYAGNYSKLLCWQFVHFLDYPEDQDSKLLLIVSNYFPINMKSYGRLHFLTSLYLIGVAFMYFWCLNMCRTVVVS